MNNDNKAEPRKREGHLQFKIAKFSEFAREEEGVGISESVEVLGLKWQIFALIHNSDGLVMSGSKSMAFYLQCKGEGSILYCTVVTTTKMLAQKEGKRDSVHIESRVFYANGDAWGLTPIASFQKLMDPENGWYDEADDSIVIMSEIKAAIPQLYGISSMARNHVLQVNGRAVKVNKHHLAASSDFFARFFCAKCFRRFFYTKMASNKLVLEPPTTVEHFERMLDTLHPMNKPLDDQCIEPVLHLASKFQLHDVEAKCRNFLVRQSKQPAIFKYRLADKYGFVTLKNLVLDLPEEEFTKRADFFKTFEEYAKLDQKAREVLSVRFARKFDQIG